MSRELDRLMDMRADEYTPEDIDTIIAMYRKQLAMFEAGIKPQRETESNIDWGNIVGNITAKKTTTVAGAPAPGQKKMKRRL